eukprot:5135218-Prymnesium_polylepis.1
MPLCGSAASSAYSVHALEWRLAIGCLRDVHLFCVVGVCMGGGVGGAMLGRESATPCLGIRVT